MTSQERGDPNFGVLGRHLRRRLFKNSSMEDQESCQYCGEVFNSAPAKFLHGLHGNTCKLYIDHVEQLDNGTLKCQICTCEFAKEMEAFVHIKKTHSNRKDPVRPKPMVAKNGLHHYIECKLCHKQILPHFAKIHFQTFHSNIITIESKVKTKQNHKLFNTKNNLMVDKASPKAENFKNCNVKTREDEVQIIDISSDENPEIEENREIPKIDENNSHTCDICDKDMGTPKRLKRHVQDWHRSVFCRYCGIEIESSSSHRRNLHNATCLEFQKIVDTKRRKCRLCGDKLPQILWLHFKENHPEVFVFQDIRYKKPKTSSPIIATNGSITIGSTTITPTRPPETNPTIKAKLNILKMNMCKTPTNTTIEKPSTRRIIKTRASKPVHKTFQNHLCQKGIKRTDDNELEEPSKKKPSLENHHDGFVKPKMKRCRFCNGKTLELEKHEKNCDRRNSIQQKFCLFCGKMHVDTAISTKFHRKRCEKFRKSVDLIKEKCLICQRPVKNIEKHFRKFHPDLIHIENPESGQYPDSIPISMDTNPNPLTTKITDEIQDEDPDKDMSEIPDEKSDKDLDKNPDKDPDKYLGKYLDKDHDESPDEDSQENQENNEDSHPKNPAATKEDPDCPGKISDIFYKCPLCKDKFPSEEITMIHLFEFHRFKNEKVSELGLKIKIVT